MPSRLRWIYRRQRHLQRECQRKPCLSPPLIGRPSKCLSVQGPRAYGGQYELPTLGGGDTAGYNPGTSTGHYVGDNTRESDDVRDAQGLDTPTRSSRPVAGDSSYSSPDSDSFATSDDDGVSVLRIPCRSALQTSLVLHRTDFRLPC